MSDGVVRGLALLCPLFTSPDMDNRAHNHWFYIAHTQKICLLQLVASDEDICNRNGKTSTLPSPVPSTYYYHFHTLLILSKDLTLMETSSPNSNNFQSGFNILMHYSPVLFIHLFTFTPYVYY